MKLFFILLSLLGLAACAPVSQTVSNVSSGVTNFVGGVVTASYQATPAELSSAVAAITPTLRNYGGYIPLAVREQTPEKVVIGATALKGNSSTILDVGDFTVEATFTDKTDHTVVALRPSSTNNETAKKVIEDYVAELDKRFARYSAE
jgi:hypothetical protein